MTVHNYFLGLHVNGFMISFAGSVLRHDQQSRSKVDSTISFFMATFTDLLVY